MRRIDVRLIVQQTLLLIVYFLLLSCTILPRSGPTTYDIYRSSYGQTPIIPITQNVANLTNINTLTTWPYSNKTDLSTYETLDIGDKLDITIWENASEGLYTGDQKGAANLGQAVVSGTGTIYMPYVGTVHAAGNTIEQLQQKIAKILKNKAINPQVIVKKAEGLSKRITIQGIVAKPGTFEITPGRHDFISVLAEAGGSTVIPELTEVWLERHGKKMKTTLINIFQSPHKNIDLRPGDNLVLSEINRSFTVLGATGTQKLIKFPKSELSLIEAIGLSSGLSDDLANPAGVFLLRREKATILNLLSPSRRRIFAGPSQVIYKLNMKQTHAVFAAQQFKIRDGDLIITTDAPYTNIRKILSSLSPAIGLGRTF
ncbi:Capsule polysaccharide export protein bexD precursor [Legionella beliardensis]|uniref:Capsule polysaccharide export protein bexD n=1 Tax=Legionella beliardensis TaxID=91822 RepID=A0A378I000_9GAMM|nr:polysaccharide biosynthesis/export family protein [Legionella beliardensis]STX28040.1 Capsule polysaccharide export protein bexD precursor [Legionella beliardensis]